MLGVAIEGARVWVANHEGTTRKLKWSWELIELNEFSPPALLAINTINPNKIIAEALEKKTIPELATYTAITAEQKYGTGSRIDFLLKRDGRPDCYLEIKNVHLRRSAEPLAEFPDSKTARGLKHLHELQKIVEGGKRAVLLFVAQRSDCQKFTTAADLDPSYAKGLKQAQQAGVEILVWDCEVTTSEVVLRKVLEFLN
jgi:sugar fermentation stimulation protein A